MIATSPDGQWAAVRRGRELSLLAGGTGPATARIELESDDADLLFVGPPSVLAAVTRGADGPRLVLYQPPYLEAVARLDLEQPMRIAGVTGPRIVLLAPDGKAITIVRVVGRGLSSQSLDPGSPVEFAVGLERNQVLLSLLRKLEAWDAVSGRPVLRMQLALPPPPRTVGPAHGHVWALRRGGGDIVVYRLSDGRPFHHKVGEPIDEVIYHPASPLLILATARGLVRLHCFAHSLTVIDAPWQPGAALAQLVAGDDISLLGMAGGDDEPWRVPIGGAGAPAIAAEPGEPSITDKLRGVRLVMGPVSPVAPVSIGEDSGAVRLLGRSGEPPPGSRGDPEAEPADVRVAPSAPIAPVPVLAPVAPVAALREVDAGRARAWREPLAAYAAELARGAEAELPMVAADTELAQLAHRLGLASQARRVLIALYGLYLIGEPGLPIAVLGPLIGDWSEPLGQGELHALAMLRRRNGRVALPAAVTDFLDGAPPRAIRLVGNRTSHGRPRPGAWQLARTASDADIETALADQLGRIAVVEGAAAVAVLEASLNAATAVALTPPVVRPSPWPREASLIVVADPPAPRWVAALPAASVTVA